MDITVFGNFDEETAKALEILQAVMGDNVRLNVSAEPEAANFIAAEKIIGLMRKTAPEPAAFTCHRVERKINPQKSRPTIRRFFRRKHRQQRRKVW